MKLRPKAVDIAASVEKDDAELAADLRAGNADALAAFFDRYGGMVFRIAQRVLGDKGEAEETTQQVFLEVYQSIDKFDPQRGSFKAWLIRKASFRAVDRRRRLETQRVYNWVSVDEDSENIATHAVIFRMTSQELGHLVHDLLRILTPGEQKVIDLRFFKGLTVREVGQETNASTSSVRRLLYGGLNKLRVAFAKKEQSETQTASNSARTEPQFDTSARTL